MGVLEQLSNDRKLYRQDQRLHSLIRGKNVWRAQVSNHHSAWELASYLRLRMMDSLECDIEPGKHLLELQVLGMKLFSK